MKPSGIGGINKNQTQGQSEKKSMLHSLATYAEAAMFLEDILRHYCAGLATYPS